VARQEKHVSGSTLRSRSSSRTATLPRAADAGECDAAVAGEVAVSIVIGP
jgi:hypothetical protein